MFLVPIIPDYLFRINHPMHEYLRELCRAITLNKTSLLESKRIDSMQLKYLGFNLSVEKNFTHICSIFNQNYTQTMRLQSKEIQYDLVQVCTWLVVFHWISA